MITNTKNKTLKGILESWKDYEQTKSVATTNTKYLKFLKFQEI